MTEPIAMIWHDAPVDAILVPLERMHAALVSDDEREHPYVHHVGTDADSHETPGFLCEINASSSPLCIGLPLGPVLPDETNHGMARAAEAIASIMHALRTLEPYAKRRMGEPQEQWLIAGLIASGPPAGPWAVHLPTPWTPLVVELDDDRDPIRTDAGLAFNTHAPKGVSLTTSEKDRPGSAIVTVNVHAIGAWIGRDGNEIDPTADPVLTMRALDAAIARGAIAR